jgi:trimeric autotransporter adhesin
VALAWGLAVMAVAGPAPSAGAVEGTISTVAGRGSGYTGDGGPAVDAGLDGPRMIAFDGRGGYYIADTFHHAVRHVDGAGTITTYAGTGKSGYSGDGGPATEARLHAPHSVDVDAAGNLIIGDPVNNRVRMVDAVTGTITTIAGTGEEGYSGDGGPATLARLGDSKVAVVGPDAAVYIADYGNSVIRRVDRSSGTITTFAGNGSARSSGDGGPALEAGMAPRSIAFDRDGDLLVVDREADSIRSIDVQTGIITTVAGSGPCPSEGPECYGGDGGPALEAQLNNPRGLGIDAAGNLFIADSDNNRVRRVAADTGLISTVAGTGKPGSRGDGGPSTKARLANPRHVAFDAAGSLYIVDTNNSRVRKVS